MTNPKQLAANRENAKKSKGPSTAEGKDASRMNAIKHGILSSHLFIPTGEENEREEFIDFQVTFLEEMQPLGILETLLVDRISGTFWRLRRLSIAETGSIRKRVESHTLQYVFDEWENFGKARVNGENTFFQRMRTSQGCKFIAAGMENIVEHIETKGFPLSDNLSRALDRQLGAKEGFFKTECIAVVDYAFRNRATEPLPDEEATKLTSGALEQAKGALQFFKGVTDILESDETNLNKADLKSKMIPHLEDLEKLQRYEAHLQRVMLQTLHELQRIQSLRMGRPAPLTAALDLNINSDNGLDL